MKKIIFVTDIPTYHKIPLFNLLSQRLKEQEKQLKVYFLRAGELRRDWDIDMTNITFDYEILNASHIQMTYEWTLIFPFSLIKHLLKDHPFFIICGGFSVATLIVVCYSVIMGIRFTVWSGEVTFAKSSRSSIREVVRKVVLNLAKNVVVYGSKAADYIKIMNSKALIFIAYNTSDVNFFAKKTNILKYRRAILLKKYGLKKRDIHLIFIGGLVKRKGCAELITALSGLHKKNKNFVLHVIGNGIEMNSLKQLSSQLRMEENVIFWGYKQKSELPIYFALGDIFVFPTLYDVWGLVLNEAMAAGLPAIASKYAGATYDLIDDGFNGFIVDPTDVGEMQSKITLLMEDRRLRVWMGQNAQRVVVNRFDIGHSLQGFLKAIQGIQSL